MDGWEVLRSEVVYRGRFDVVKDLLHRPDGGTSEYVWTPAGGAVAVLPFDDQGSVILTKQYRHPLRRTILDLPAGGVELGEDLETAARRELREETGYTADVLKPLGAFHPSPGRSPTTVYVYEAHGLHAGPTQPDETEFIEVVRMPWDRALAMVLGEEPIDGALGYAVLAWHARHSRSIKI